MSRALYFARLALESSGDLGLAVSISLTALQFIWLRRRGEPR